MASDDQIAARLAQEYLGTTDPLVRLGWGMSGFVYLSPNAQTAVKVHRYQEHFEYELNVYRRLRLLKLTRLHKLTIPKLIAAQPSVKILQMDFVRPPYLLDFAGARLQPPDFSPEVIEHWHADIAEKFGANTDIVYAVYHALIRHGIYYLDFRPSNLNLAGHPGLKSNEPDENDDVD